MGGNRFGAALALAVLVGGCGPESGGGSNQAAPADRAADANAADSGAPTSDVGKRVVKIVTDMLGVDPGRVMMGARFMNDLGADSLDMVEMVLASEEEFGVEIPDDAAERMVTVGDMVNYIEDNLPG